MLEIKVKTEDGRHRLRPSDRELAELVRRIGGEGDHFLVVQRIPDLPDDYIQVWHDGGEDYTVQYRDGRPDQHYQAVLDGPEPVVAVMTAWARREPGWNAGSDWSPVDLGSAEPVPPLDLDADDLAELEKCVRVAVLSGYGTRAEMVEVACEYLVTEDDPEPVSRAQGFRLVDRLWRERVAEQAGWEGETDPERLTRAFEALDDAGITARENFTCCRSCGMAEIGGDGSPDARGFVFFHLQGTESAVGGHGLMLYYGGFDGSSETTAAVGHEVVAALRGAGLPATWDGDPGRAIDVEPLDWRRRLVG